MIAYGNHAARLASTLAPRPRALRVGVLALGGIGGSSRVAHDLAQGLREQGHVAIVLGQPEPWPELHGRLPSPCAPVVVPLPVPRDPRPAAAGWVEPLADAIVDATLAHDLQVLSVHYGVGLVEAAVLARRRLAHHGRTLRICATLHGTDVTTFGQDPDQGPTLALALRACDEVTAVSGWLADRAVHALGLPRRPEVIPNGVDTERFHPASRPRPRPRPVLCHVTSFRAIKRPLDALEVLDRLLHTGVDAELLMVGEGPLLPVARDRAHALRLDHRVRFVPPASPSLLAGLLRTVDLSLVTSESESFGLFALESMASGVPVLGTRCGGLQEVLLADGSGELERALLAEVGDVDALARLAAAVLRDPGQLERLRERALRLGRGAYPHHRHVGAHADLLGRIVARGEA